MRLQIFGHFVFVCKNQKNQFSVNDSLGGIRFWPATWDAITVSYIFLALQNCMRYIYTQKMSHVSLGHLCTASLSLPSTAKFILGPIYIHNTNAADITNQPNSVVFTRWNILPLWNDGGRLTVPSHFSTHVLFMYSEALVLNDTHWFWHWGFHALPQPVRASTINAHGSIQRSPLYSPLMSGLTGLQMSVSPSWEERILLRVKSSTTLLVQKKKKINVAWQLCTCLLNKPYQNSTFMKADVSKQRLYTEWTSLKLCFDIWGLFFFLNLLYK